MATLKHPRVLRIIPLLIVVCFINFPAQAQYGGGSGTANDPYQIWTAEQMNTIGAEPNDWDRHFKLMADLDLEGVNLNPIGYWSYDEEEAKAFEGTFDGNGKTIANLRRSNAISGVFEYVSRPYAEIRNLILIDPNVHGGGGIIGSLVGRLYGGTVRDCAVIGGHVSGGIVGGPVGIQRNSVIKNCFSSASVSGEDYVGGLVGRSIDDVIIMNCVATGNAQGKKYVGGLIGESGFIGDYKYITRLIVNCGATGTVHGDYTVGGLVGTCDRDTVIASSFASGDVSVVMTGVGGLVGHLDSDCRIISCYANGDVSSEHSGGIGGGLIGTAFSSYIIDCYATGRVNGEHMGGLSGRSLYCYDCFWDTEASGILTGSVGTGLTTAEMHDPNTFINAGWDFVGELDNGPSDIWIMPESGGYPLLWWQVSPLPPLPTFSGGTGEPDNPFIVSTPEELNSIGHNPRLMNAHFMLGNNIDLAGTRFFLVGSQGHPFGGIFDGNGYAIRNFSHEANPKDSRCVGLFRYLRGMNTEVRDLTISGHLHVGEADESHAGLLVGMLYDGAVVNCHSQNGEVVAVTTSSDYGVGGLIGYNRFGFIDRCSSEGTIQGEDFVGGLLGNNMFGTIYRCNSKAIVKGHFNVGGLLGRNRTGEVMNCHTSGGVSGNMVGGLVGENWGYLCACSASGNVSSIWQCVGGLVGYNWNTIVASCSYGDVVGYESVGGLVGQNVGRMSHCYARGAVSGEEYVGGLVGDNTYYPYVAGSIVTSYSSGSVSGQKNVGGLVGWVHAKATTGDDCFWDIETSGQATSAGGTGLTTTEMQTAKTFLEAGWDFVDEMENGTEDIWWILEGQDYPRLWWELSY